MDIAKSVPKYCNFLIVFCGVLTDSKDALTARKYWNKLKQRLKEIGNETVTNCHQLKLRTADGKMRQPPSTRQTSSQKNLPTSLLKCWQKYEEL